MVTNAVPHATIQPASQSRCSREGRERMPRTAAVTAKATARHVASLTTSHSLPRSATTPSAHMIVARSR